MTSLRDIDVIAPNFKRRLSGVTSTIVQLVPFQREQGQKIAAVGPGLPPSVERIGYFSLLGLWRKPASGRPFRIWHARRNVEMVAGVLVRDVFRAPLRLVFTSDAQRHHRAFTKWLIGRMDAVVTTSARAASYLKVPYFLVPHGVDTRIFHPPANGEDDFSASGLGGKFAVGCFGRVRHQKGTDLFVDSMISLLPHYPDWTAVITGRVTAEHKQFADTLRKRVAEAGLSNRVVFAGEVDDVRLWYRRLTLYVAPSRNEGYGLTPLEAMASQTAAVTSDAGAYRDMIIEGQTGLVVAAGDGEALTGAIEQYLKDPELARRHGANALRHVRENFGLKRESDGLAEVYEAVWQEN